MKILGNKNKFAIKIDERSLASDLCGVNIYINTRNICCDDNQAYLPTFICSMENEMTVLKNIQDKAEFRKYFEGKTIEQSHAFISSTRDPASPDFDCENDELYVTYRVLNWSETTDNVTCFIVPSDNKYYLTYEFWREAHEVKSEIGLINHVQIDIAEMIVVIQHARDQIKTIFKKR